MSVSLKIVVRFFLKYWEAIYKCGICLKGENGLNRITEITKLDILDLFQNGLDEYSGRFYTSIPEIGNRRSDVKETALPF